MEGAPMSLLPKSKSYSRRSIGAVLLVGVLAGATVGSGVGVIAASSTKSVTVCANKAYGFLRYAEDGKCVTNTETKVVLNQTGDTGAKGAAGAAGASSPTGFTARSVAQPQAPIVKHCFYLMRELLLIT